MRRLPVVLLTLLATSHAGAQINRSRSQLKGPAEWISFGTTLQKPWTVTDGATGSRWEFGNSTPYEASLEKALSGGASFGVRGSTATVPLVYVGPLATTDADANVSQLFGTLRMTSGSGAHTVIELSAGATIYSNFRSRTDGAKLGPDTPDADFSFALGYGVGYNLTPSFSIDVVQDVTTVMHQKTGLSAGDDSSARINGTRIVGRIGFGGH